MRMGFIEAKHGRRERAEVPKDFDSNCYETPPQVFRYLDNKYNFIMDLAASKKNALCEEHFDEKDNALRRPWSRSGYLYINPPFNPMKPWMKKIQEEADAGCRIVVLCASNTLHTNYYIERPAEHEYRWIGRMSFCINGTPVKGNASCQALLVFNKRLKPKVGNLILKDIINNNGEYNGYKKEI